MRTRSTDTTKSAATQKKTPPAKKSSAKTQTTPTSSEPSDATATPKSSDGKRGPSISRNESKSAETISTPTPSSESVPEPPPAVEGKKALDDAEVITGAKPALGTKKIRRVVKKVVRKTPIAKANSKQTPKSEDSGLSKAEEPTKENDVVGEVEPEYLHKEAETAQTDEVNSESVVESAKTEDAALENIEGSVKEDLNALTIDNVPKTEEEEVGKEEKSLNEDIVKFSQEQVPAVTDVEPLENVGPTQCKEEEELRVQEEEELKTTEDKVEPKSDAGKMEEDSKEEMTDFDGLFEEADDVGIADQEMHDEFGQEDFANDTEQEGEEAVALEEERAELNAVRKERKLRKELEIFVGGLDRDVVEEDIKKVFQNAGEVVDVRLHKDLSTTKGYAFVRFATKEQATRALSEMKNPVIRGKRCGTAPTEDNDTLFLGNICNTWTKEAIKHKLKEYGIEGIEKITLVADPKNEGLSRGFAFLEFSCHAEAMLAYKRLQKPDVIFGHSERSAKVAFAEPLREPDPEVMSQVKSVFVDGLPPYWDEDRVREKFKKFGEIARIMLARNMSTAKRKDFGFVDFTTHETAVMCIEGINNAEFSDGNSKTKIKARLSNPLPKSQAIKGEMAGGFRIARSSGGTFSRFGRGFGRGGQAFNRANFQHGRGFYPRGPGQGFRMGFANGREFDSSYPPFRGRQNFGHGGRWGFRGSHQVPSGGPIPIRPYLDRGRHGGHGVQDPVRRLPFPSEGGVNQPYFGRHFDDSYYYDDSAPRMKRPYFMMDQNPDYPESSVRRPRFEYAETPASLDGTHYRVHTFGADAGPYPQDYYGSDYGGGMQPSFYRGDRPYGHGYY